MSNVAIQPTNLETWLSQVRRTRLAIKTASKNAVNDAIQPVAQAYRQNLQSLRSDQPAVMKVNQNGTRVTVPRPMRIAESVGTKVWAFPDQSGVAGYVGTRSGKAPHAHLIENGTRYRLRLRIGGKYALVEFWINQGMHFRHEQDRRTGIMPAFHPLANAVASGSASSTQILRTRLAEYTKAAIQ